MQTERPYVLTIAGFDPCSGAGITADIKTFEQLKVYGLAICTGLTLQTEDNFHSIEWRKLETIEKELDVILKKYPVKSVKFGIVPSLDWLITLSAKIKKHNSQISIVVDPIMRSSTGFELADFTDNSKLNSLSGKINILTPNLEEIKQMAGSADPFEYARGLAGLFNVLVKGGHSDTQLGMDMYHDHDSPQYINAGTDLVYAKHGSGCVLSAAITANLAYDMTGYDACKKAKQYTEKFLSSNQSLLGFHAS